MKKLILFAFAITLSMVAKPIVSKTVNVEASGSLASLINDELSIITNLTITGDIDARDFKTLRDNMPLLAVLDLKSANIVGYTGNEGTAGNVNTEYIANEIPDFALAKDYPGDGILKSIIMPASANSIGRSAFYCCRGLTGDLNIPSTIKAIGISAYAHCSGFKGELTIPESVESIGMGAFSNCSGLTGHLIIPPSISSIGNETFYKCTGFNGSLTIPSTISSIGNYAFAYCSGLTGDLIIPSSVETIDHSAFLGCRGFSGILSISSSLKVIERRVFNGCIGLSGKLTIPPSITVILESAFGNCSGFTGHLEIPSSVQIMGNAIFEYCSGIESVTISAMINSFGNGAFQGCSNLKDVNIISNITTIPYTAFFMCEKLETFTIPSSVSTIGEQAFSGCSNLWALKATRSTPIDMTKTSLVFLGVDKATCKLYVPVASKTSYENAFQWKDFNSIIEGDIPTKINNTNGYQIVVHIDGRCVTISEIIAGQIIFVYDMQGVLITSDISRSNTIKFMLPFPGVYIVKIGSQSKTLMI